MKQRIGLLPRRKRLPCSPSSLGIVSLPSMDLMHPFLEACERCQASLRLALVNSFPGTAVLAVAPLGTLGPAHEQIPPPRIVLCEQE